MDAVEFFKTVNRMLDDLNESQELANNPDAVRPTAHWVSDSTGSTNVVCSACNAISFAAYNFCPECGKGW